MPDEGAEQFIVASSCPASCRASCRWPVAPLRAARGRHRGALPALYPGLELVRAHTFRVTRSAQMDLTGEPLDMLQLVEEEVTRRPFQEVVRLEVEHAMPPEMRHRLLREFQYELEEQLSTPGEQDVYTVGRLVDLASLKEIAAIDEPALNFEPLRAARAARPERSVFEQVA
jgi:polyphosphate kinase